MKTLLRIILVAASVCMTIANRGPLTFNSASSMLFFIANMGSLRYNIEKDFFKGQ